MLNLCQIIAFTWHLKIDLCRILIQLRSALLLRSLFATSTIVLCLASNQYLEPTYSQFLLLCGTLLLPCISHADLNEASSLTDQFIIGFGLLGSIMFLIPFEPLPTVLWYGELGGLLLGMLSGVAFAYTLSYSRQMKGIHWTVPIFYSTLLSVLALPALQLAVQPTAVDQQATHDLWLFIYIIVMASL